MLKNTIIPHTFKYGAMTLERRRQILPARSICSLYPAADFSEALITGNGFERVDVLCDPYNDALEFTQEALYEPTWAKTPQPPDLNGVLPAARRLMLENKFVEAAELVEKAQIEAGFSQYMDFSSKGAIGPTSPLQRHQAFTLGIRQPEAGATKNYLRWLDMMNGKITVQWENDRGAFTRETFISYKDNVAVQQFSAPGGALDADVTITLPVKPGMSGMPGISGIRAPKLSAHELEITDDLITLKWAYCPEFGQKGYVSVIRFIRRGGTAECIENGVRITGADSMMILSKTVKFEGGFTYACAQSVADAVLAIAPDYDALLKANTEHIGSRMGRSGIHLGDEADFALSGEELLQRTHSTAPFDGTMLEKLYDMGRFFQITDTGNIPPMWGQHNINTNLQVCAGNNTGLFDEMDVYFRYYESKFDDFRTNARRLFGARGLLASVHCDYDSGLFYHFSKTYPHYCWTGCLGWIYNELWGYYLVSGDMEFLKNRIVPALEEIALFFEDYACDRGPDGKVIFYPSFSPENPTPEYATRNGVYAASINSVMDIMICREVLDNLMEACNTLGIEQEKLPHWQAQKDSLPNYLLDEEGGLKEWAWPSVSENYNHRHVSHHYDVWPGHAVTWEEEPELAKAITISNRKRGQQDDSAHGIIHRLFTAIRLKDMIETEQNLYQLMNHGFVLRTLCTNHYPYIVHCPDLQGAMPAILLEMCVYSAPGTVEFLPAMPSSLEKGSIEGVWLYTWAKLERLAWCEKGLTAAIVSGKVQKLILRCRRSFTSFRINGTEMPAEGDHVQYAFKENEKIEIEITF
jgi:alpha-L-fucosidase 2